jgi:hypothetical protein
MAMDMTLQTRHLTARNRRDNVKARFLLMVLGFLPVMITSVQAELRCREEKDICFMRCDPDGKNCYNDCPKRKVCEEVKPSQQTIRPAGGVRNDKLWGGFTIPLDPKFLKPDLDANE